MILFLFFILDLTFKYFELLFKKHRVNSHEFENTARVYIYHDKYKEY